MTSPGRFTRTGWRRVLDQVGEGHLTGTLTIDQVYAKYQHERTDLVHPRGGGPAYARRPLFANYQDYISRVAKALLDGDPERAMADCMESLNSATAKATPVQFTNLRRSGHPRVYSNGRRVYDRTPWQHRLSREELRVLRRKGRRR